MKRLLIINATLDKEISKTYYIYNNIKKEFNLNNYIINEINLYETYLPVLSLEIMKEQNEKYIQSDDARIIETLSDEFKNADAYIFIFPTWNLSVPSKLKVYIDVVCYNGKAFKYTEHGPTGLLNNRPTLLINSCGGDNTSALNYMHEICQFMGLNTKQVFVPNTSYAYKDNSEMINNIDIDENFFQ